MSRDIALWLTRTLSEDERRIIKRNLGFFVTADCYANNIVLGTYRHITAPECASSAAPGLREGDPHPRLPVHRGVAGLDEAEIFNAYHEVQAIRDKDEFLIPFIDAIMGPDFHTGTPRADQTLLKSLIVFACLMEGLFFFRRLPRSWRWAGRTR